MTAADVTKPIGDGLPEILAEWIRFNGLHHIKIKLQGDELNWDIDRVVGIDRIRAFHLNDSKKPLASRVDRHDHIGEGCLGLEPFRHLMNDSRFVDRPMYLETKKEEREGEDMDAVNLRTLLGLIRE